MRSISTDYSQNPQRKVIFFPYIFVFDCFKLASRIANGERSRRSAARRLSGLVKQGTAITRKTWPGGGGGGGGMQSENVES